MRAIDLALVGRIDAITTLPLNKESLSAAGVAHPGHTEILAERCGAREHAMMLFLPGDADRPGLGVVHATLHVALRDVFALLTRERVAETIALADSALRPLTGGRPPRVAVAGLNPHAGEHGLFGDEEILIIAPAVAEARRSGIDVTGPIAADTLFSRAVAGEFDVVVAMYHDQGHVAIKTIGFDRRGECDARAADRPHQRRPRNRVRHREPGPRRHRQLDLGGAGRGANRLGTPRDRKPMTRIFLLRHGATSSNRQVPYRLQGRWSDHPLDALGITQATRAAEALSSVKFAAAYSSPLSRALETARLIVAPRGLEPQTVSDLIEADLGRWEGLTWDEARARDPELFDRFMADPGAVPYPDGESFLDVQRRVAPALAAVAERHPDADVLVVGHNVVNRAYLALPLGIPISRARAIRQSNGGINIIEFEGANATVVCLNACLHLEGLTG